MTLDDESTGSASDNSSSSSSSSESAERKDATSARLVVQEDDPQHSNADDDESDRPPRMEQQQHGGTNQNDLEEEEASDATGSNSGDDDDDDDDVEMEDPDETASEPEMDGNDDEDTTSNHSMEDKSAPASPAKSDLSNTVAAVSLLAPHSSSLPPTPAQQRPRMRIKLKLSSRALQTTTTPTTTPKDISKGVRNQKSPTANHREDDEEEEDQDNEVDDEVHATVVVADDANDDDSEVDAVAIPIGRATSSGTTTPNTTTATCSSSPSSQHKAATKKVIVPMSTSMLFKRPNNSDKMSIGSGKKPDRPRLSNLFRKALPITAAGRTSTATATMEEGGEDDSIQTAGGKLERQQPDQQQRSRGTQSAVDKTAHTAAISATSRSNSSSSHRQVKLPPIASPGLLLPSSGQGPRHAAAAAAAIAAKIGDEDGYISSQQLFRTTMATSAGYTYEQRSQHPHRGSSVERTVGDLFDTPLHLATANKPVQLVEPDLWNATLRKRAPPAAVVQQPLVAEDAHPASLKSPANGETAAEEEEIRLTDLVLQNIQQSRPRDRKRPRQSYSCTPFAAMVPVSLTIAYPDDYLERQLQYVHDVEKREAAIVAWQEEQEKIEKRMEEHEWNAALHMNPDETEDENNNNKDKELSWTNAVTIPPIPEPPTPPQWHELGATPTIMTLLEEQDGDNPQDTKRQRRYFYHHLDDPDNNRSPDFVHPICIAKGQEKLVAHLDKHCFHITQGRYFALQSSHTADPNFCGANAPGIAGVTTGGGLATATTSTTTSTSGLSGGGMTMILSTSFHSAAAVPANRDGQQQQQQPEITSSTTSRKDKESMEKTKVKKEERRDSVKPAKVRDTVAMDAKTTAEKPKLSSAAMESSKGPNNNSTKSNSKKTKTSNDLRKKLDVSLTDAATVQAFRNRIIGAAVSASRKSKHLSNFKGPDGELYPDVAKAFAAYSGLKPCERCKSNKQGTYHCRLRRRHMELDFDGGDSIEILKPYLNEDELSEKKGTPLAKGISNPSDSTPEPPREAPASPGDVATVRD